MQRGTKCGRRDTQVTTIMDEKMIITGDVINCSGYSSKTETNHEWVFGWKEGIQEICSWDGIWLGLERHLIKCGIFCILYFFSESLCGKYSLRNACLNVANSFTTLCKCTKITSISQNTYLYCYKKITLVGEWIANFYFVFIKHIFSKN